MSSRFRTTVILLTAFIIALVLTAAFTRPPATASRLPRAGWRGNAGPGATGVEGPRSGHPAADWQFQMRARPDGTVGMDVLAKLRAQFEAQRERISRRSTIGDEWLPLGPFGYVERGWKCSGRVTAVSAHPTNADTYYIGASSAGIWRSTDAGANWTALSTPFGAVKALALDPVAPAIMYVGTEGDYVRATDGLWRSADGGESWLSVPLPKDMGSVGNVLIDPRTAGSTRARLYVQGAFLQRSEDGGATFVDISPASRNGGVSIRLDPSNPDTLYVAAKTPALTVYKSDDRGNHWQRSTVRDGNITLWNNSIAVAASDPRFVYVVFGAGDGPVLARSEDGGATWSETTVPAYRANPYQAWTGAVTVNPKNALEIVAGNLDLAASSDGGKTWVNPTTPHEDQIAFDWDAQGRLLLASDGGIFRQKKPGGWEELNTADITEFYTVAPHPGRFGMAFGGTQDNGTLQWTAGSGWAYVSGGDGGWVAIAEQGDMPVYSEHQYSGGTVGVFRNTLGAQAYHKFTAAADERGMFLPPLAVDPGRSNKLCVGLARVYCSEDSGATWTGGDVLTGNRRDLSGKYYGTSVYITALAIGPAAIYAGLNNGEVWVSRGGGSWVSTGGRCTSGSRCPGVTGFWTGDIVIDPAEPNTAYAVFGATGCELGHVYRTRDLGEHWEDLTLNLPDLAVTSIALDSDTKPPTVYVSTDLAVFRLQDEKAGWQPFGRGLPAIGISKLAWSKKSDTLFAATYGRGVWAISSRFSRR